MNYTELVAAITSWLNRNNFTALTNEIDTFILLATERINTDPDFRLISLWAQVTLDTASPTIPTDFAKGISTVVGDSQGGEVLWGPVREVQSKQWQNGRPAVMSPLGTDFIFAPSPNQAFDLNLVYQKKLPVLDGTTTTHELVDEYPSLMLWACLTEALMWLKDDQRAAVWEGRYRDTLQKIKGAEEMKQYPGGQLRVRDPQPKGFETVRLNSR